MCDSEQMKQPVAIRKTVCRHARHIAAALAAALALLPGSLAAQTIEQKAQLCTACHGESGAPQEKTTPTLWGQQLGYLFLQLRDYKSGARKNAIMAGFAQTLTPQDIANLAAYYSAQPAVLSSRY